MTRRAIASQSRPQSLRPITNRFYKGKYRIYSNKRRIWDKKGNKRRPRISAAVSMRRSFEDFRIT